MKKFLTICLVVVLTITFSFASVLAQDTTNVNTSTDQTQDNQVVAPEVQKQEEIRNEIRERIEKEVLKDIDASVVQELKAKGFDFNKIALMAMIAEKTGKTIDEVAKVFEEQKSIYKICRKLGLDFKDYIKIQKELKDRVKEATKEAIKKENEEGKTDEEAKDQEERNEFNDHKTALITAIAEKSGKTVEEVTKIFEKQKSPLKVCKELGLTVKDYVEIQKSLRKNAENAQKEQERDREKEQERDREKEQERDREKVKEHEPEVIEGIDPAVVERLRNEGFGYGKIVLAVGLAEKSGKTIDEVVAILKDGKGIGEIARELGLKVGDVIKEKIKAEREQKKFEERERNKNLEEKNKEKNQHVKGDEEETEETEETEQSNN